MVNLAGFDVLHPTLDWQPRQVPFTPLSFRVARDPGVSGSYNTGFVNAVRLLQIYANKRKRSVGVANSSCGAQIEMYAEQDERT
jgi:hypothetical protein